jgi:hypothetical protein
LARITEPAGDTFHIERNEAIVICALNDADIRLRRAAIEPRTRRSSSLQRLLAQWPAASTLFTSLLFACRSTSCRSFVKACWPGKSGCGR